MGWIKRLYVTTKSWHNEQTIRQDENRFQINGFGKKFRKKTHTFQALNNLNNNYYLIVFLATYSYFPSVHKKIQNRLYFLIDLPFSL